MEFKKIRIGTRASNLALKQALLVKESLVTNLSYPEDLIELIPIKTMGDKNLDKKINELGVKGIFTKEIEEMILSKEVDFGVHSLKDMPAVLPEGLIIKGVLEREDPRDALVGFKGNIRDLPKNSVIATSSLRREAQIKAIRNDFKFIPIRGNVETRIQKAESRDFTASILAVAGMKRLNISVDRYVPIEIHDIIPAAAQGIIGIESRSEDNYINGIIDKISCATTYQIALIEREFLKAWEEIKYKYTKKLVNTCQVPIAAHANIKLDKIFFTSMVASEDFKMINYYKAEINQDLKKGLELARTAASEFGKKVF